MPDPLPPSLADMSRSDIRLVAQSLAWPIPAELREPLMNRLIAIALNKLPNVNVSMREQVSAYKALASMNSQNLRVLELIQDEERQRKGQPPSVAVQVNVQNNPALQPLVSLIKQANAAELKVLRDLYARQVAAGQVIDQAPAAIQNAPAAQGEAIQPPADQVDPERNGHVKLP